MLLITERCIDGIKFIDKIEVVEPIERRNGVEIEYVSDHILDEVRPVLKILGYKLCGHSNHTNLYIFTRGHKRYYIYKIVEHLLHIYFHSIHWSYDNLRLFKEIPPAETFHWSYFTPYQHILSIIQLGKNLLGKK